jgi:hypothetical protein
MEMSIMSPLILPFLTLSMHSVKDVSLKTEAKIGSNFLIIKSNFQIVMDFFELFD